MTEEALVLDASVDPDPELLDHPLDLTDEEIAQGLLLWSEIDDLDDDSSGLFPVGMFGASPGYAEAKRRADVVRTCLLAAGVPEVSIELLDGRPGTGDTWNACKPYSVMSHHIASTPTPENPTPGLSLVKRGRSDLPGPLCNGTAGVDLVYRIICMGMANHPGEGGPWTVGGPMGRYTIPQDVARPYAWGTEFEGGYSDAVWDRTYTNARTGKSMTFREFMGRANAGLTRAIWLINGQGKNPGEPGEHDLSGYHGEHKTWAPGRKPDRLNYDTDSGRAEVRRYNDGGDDVSAKDVWDFMIKPAIEGAKDIPARVMLTQTHKRATEGRKAALAAQKNAEKALTAARAAKDAVVALADSLPDNGVALAKVTAAYANCDLDVVAVEDIEPDEVDSE